MPLASLRIMQCVTLTMCISIASVIPESSHKKDPLSEEPHTLDGEHNIAYDHEAFLGGEEAAREYEKLSEGEAKEKLAKLIPKIDADGDGMITLEELTKHINFMHNRFVLKDVERTWAIHTKRIQKKGEEVPTKIAWEQYREAIYGPADATEQPDQHYAVMLERDEKRFKVADQDGDGSLDKDEYACFMHPERCDHMKDIIIDETIGDIDRNKDGMIDPEEYIMDMHRPETEGEEEPDWVKSERELFSEYRDKDGDGKMNRAEIAEWIMPAGFDHAEAEAAHLTNLADDDKDGSLSADEIIAHYDVFVGSQATNYGEQLRAHDPSDL